MVHNIEGGAAEYRPLPAKAKSDKEKIVDNIRTSALLGPLIATQMQMTQQFSKERLPDSMKFYLTIEQDKLIVKAEFLDKATFPELSQLKNVLANIREIQNPKTQKRLSGDLLRILEGKVDKENQPPEVVSFMEALRLLSGEKEA